MNKPWYLAVAQCHEVGEAYVLVTVLGAQGSTPREPGAKMVVTEDHTYDTIGGGQLEYLVTQDARQRLRRGQAGVDLQAYPLAAQAKQCCGGHVSIMLESVAPSDWRLAVFGAGHVAQQLIPILARMPAQVLWLDNRQDFVVDRPDVPETKGVELALFDDPTDAILHLPPGTDVIILTHDHGLDFELSKVALARPDLPFVGCIGSATKARRFERRLLQAGVSNDALQRWICPIGLPEVSGKLPIEVAVSISAQLIARRQLHSQHQHDHRGLAWRELKTVLAQRDQSSVTDAAEAGDTHSIAPKKEAP